MRRSYYSLVLVFLMLSFPTILLKATAINGTSLFVDPASVLDVPVGNEFTVDLNVADVENLFTWQIKLLYDPTVLTCTGADYPMTDYIFEGKAAIPVTPTIDNTAGFVTFGASLIGADSASGSGKLCQISFEVLTEGESSLEYSTPYGGDTFLLDGALAEIPATVQDGYFSNIPTPRHDVAVTELSLSDNRPREGDSVTISVTVLNNGTVTETFDVEVSYDAVLIETQTVNLLAAGNTESLIFTWDTTGVPLGSHTIKAEALAVDGEIDLLNNVLTKPITVISATALNTDINGDGVVNMLDIGAAGSAFGTKPGDDRWRAEADVDGDGEVTVIDIATIARDFGKSTV
jgi:hypothetical protein